MLKLMKIEMNLGAILVDDSFIDRTIFEKNIQLFYPDMPVVTFSSASAALEALSNEDTLKDVDYSVILLDIYMPEMNGFAFADAFNQLPKKTRDRYCIVMLSSSIDQGDMDKVASRSKTITKFVSKPLNNEVLEDIFKWTKQNYSALNDD